MIAGTSGGALVIRAGAHSGIKKRDKRLRAKSTITCLVLLASLLLGEAAFAQEKGFNAARESEVQAYIKQQIAAGIAPRGSSPHWKKGYTCQDLLRHDWAEYRECRYYYKVNGRYFPN